VNPAGDRRPARWPGHRLAGEAGAHAGWLLAQHGPPDLQKLDSVGVTRRRGRHVRPCSAQPLRPGDRRGWAALRGPL